MRGGYMPPLTPCTSERPDGCRLDRLHSPNEVCAIPSKGAENQHALPLQGREEKPQSPPCPPRLPSVQPSRGGDLPQGVAGHEPGSRAENRRLTGAPCVSEEP